MPDVQPFYYMISLIAEIGLNGVTWGDIHHWMELSGVQLRLWEIKQIKKLSMMYHNYSKQYEGSSVPPPYRDFDTPTGVPLSTREQIRNDRR
tara:strand:- start:325 stop:600 length:276 start_codon:yes stop_codon:yes gene_type:complete